MCYFRLLSKEALEDADRCGLADSPGPRPCPHQKHWLGPKEMDASVDITSLIKNAMLSNVCSPREPPRKRGAQYACMAGSCICRIQRSVVGNVLRCLIGGSMRLWTWETRIHGAHSRRPFTLARVLCGVHVDSA